MDLSIAANQITQRSETKNWQHITAQYLTAQYIVDGHSMARQGTA